MALTREDLDRDRSGTTVEIAVGTPLASTPLRQSTSLDRHSYCCRPWPKIDSTSSVEDIIAGSNSSSQPVQWPFNKEHRYGPEGWLFVVNRPGCATEAITAFVRMNFMTTSAHRIDEHLIDCGQAEVLAPRDVSAGLSSVAHLHCS